MILEGSIKNPKKKIEAIKKAMAGINRLNDTTKDFLDASDLEGKEIELELEGTKKKVKLFLAYIAPLFGESFLVDCPYIFSLFHSSWAGFPAELFVI